MNTLGFVFMLLSIWVLSSFWFLAYSSDARVNPFVSIDSDPVIPTETEPPISLIPSQMAPQSSGVADGRVAHHQEISKTILVTLIIASSLVALILLSLLLFHLFRKTNMKNSNSKSKPVQDSIKGLPLGPIVGKFSKNGSVASIEYQFLVAATNGFGKDNILGEGEFGFLYKAQFKSNVLAAVKRIESGTLDAEKEFQNEVDWLSKLSHQNIVSLLGYCFRSDFKFLVYEMVHNGPLESHLHGPSHGSNLTWHLRMKIALDIARGLEFLHERCNPPVIHRDLTSSNILLDYKFNAKLSAFGQAIASGSRTKENLKLSLTMGYVAPEYLSDGKLTDKSDVYAFGVILLELLTGRKAFEKTSSTQQQSIVTWAMPHLSDRLKLPSIIDPTIRDTMDLKHLYQVAAIAVLCVQPEPSYRPLITDVLHSFIPLVPHELGGSLRISVPVETSNSN